MEGGDFSSMMTQLGIMNKVSTGNSVLDILLCLLVPVLLQHITPWLMQLYNKLMELRKRPSTTNVRTIVYQKRSDWITTLGNSNNHHLQEALLFKINIMPDVTKAMIVAEAQLLTNKNNNISNSPDNEDGDRPDNSNSDDGYSDDGHDEWYDGKDCERLEVALVPPTDIAIKLTPDITFIRNVVNTSSDGRTEVITTFTLQWQGTGGSEALDAFLKSAYDDYRTMLRGKPRDTARYLYMPVMAAPNTQAANNDDAVSPFTYRRYKLSEDKSFANFFHPEKQDILNLVHSFTNKAGKFSIAGYPHKLGFLLWGPPGTGKTSFIKALAQLTRRSIVNIPLARIRTNQEMMDLMFAQSVQVQGQSTRHYLPFHKVIYVMEDVDAASHVVQRRAPDQQPAGAGALGGPSCAPLLLMAEEEEAAAAAQTSKSAVSSPMMGPMSKEMAAWMKADDALNLAGLLNILDGVVDTPGRIVIMTSNHPEKLDPALIRPGRINKKLYMGHLAIAEALGMVRHYFGDLTADQVDRLTKMWVVGTVSPATLESMCAEHETVEQLLVGLADTEALARQQQQQELLRQEAKQQEVARALAAAAAAAAAEAAAAEAEAGEGEEDGEAAESTAESPAAAAEQEGEGGEVDTTSSSEAAADCDVVLGGGEQQPQCDKKGSRPRKGSRPSVSAFAAAAEAGEEQQQDVTQVCDQKVTAGGLLAAAAAEVLRQQSLPQEVVTGEEEGLEECASIDRQPSTPLRLAP